MGLLTLIRNAQNISTLESNPRVKELRSYIEEVNAQLELDWSQRLNGDGVYSGYNTLRDFYKGKQWSYRKEGGGTMRTYNYCFTIVENMTAFLTNEAPQMSCPPNEASSEIDRVMAEGRTKMLNEVHEENGLSLVFQRAVRTGSICGDSFVFGPIPTFKVNEKGDKTFDNIRYWNVERPETIRVIWKDENYNEIGGFIKHYRISVATAKKLFTKEIAESGLIVQEDFETQNSSGNNTATNVPMCTVEEYWTEDEYLLLFNNSKKPVHYLKHDWGFLPLHFVPNIHLPGEPKGTSDLENELDPQQEYNERASDLADIIKEISRPAYWGKNLDNLTEVRSGQLVIYQVGDDGDIQAMPKSGTTAPIDSYLADRKNDMIGLSGLNNVLYPGTQTLNATRRALSVVMQGVNNKIALRKEWWVKAFKEINAGILFLIELYMPETKPIIAGNYRSDVFISSVLLRSVSDEINKFQSKVQSLTTTQHNVGIDNPSEEQKLMKEELQDEILATEIAKQPGLLHQILADRVAQMNQAGGMSAVGGAGINAAAPPIASESDNVPGENPQSGAGVAPPVSPQGAIRNVAAKNGAPTPIKK